MKFLAQGKAHLGYTPDKFWENASEDARELVLSCLKDLDADKILDCHVHLVATGPEGKNGCYVHENMYDECCHPKSAIKRRAIIMTTGFDVDEAKIDEYYVENVTSIFANFLPPESAGAVKVSLLGMDEWYDEDGKARPDKTTLHVNNMWLEHVTKMSDAEKRQRHFRIAPSIHPYKKTAVEELHYWYKRGARQIKWLPNAQGIDPMSERCDPFYDALIELDMWLLSHTGTEHTLDDAGWNNQALGNPLLLRRPLEKGVNVIAAHCASTGYYKDIDNPDKNGKYKKVQSVKLLFRMMEKHKNLYTDISGSTSFTRTALTRKVLMRTDLHERMIFATDFPVPAIQPVVWLFFLTVAHDLIPPSCVPLLREIYLYNPALSDFVKKRIMRWKAKDGKCYRFPNSVFQHAPTVYKDNWFTPLKKQEAECQAVTVLHEKKDK